MPKKPKKRSSVLPLAVAGLALLGFVVVYFVLTASSEVRYQQEIERAERFYNQQRSRPLGPDSRGDR